MPLKQYKTLFYVSIDFKVKPLIKQLTLSLFPSLTTSTLRSVVVAAAC